MKTSEKSGRDLTMRKRIIYEAIRLFGERGYEGTSLQSIAEAVGIKRPSLFHHFTSKEQMIEEVVDELLSNWTHELPTLLSDVTSGYETFSSTIKSLVRFFMGDTNRARLAIREMLDRPDHSGEVLNEKLSPWISLLINYVNMGKEAGIIRKNVDPKSYLILTWLMVMGTAAIGNVLKVVVGADKESMTPMVEELVRIARVSLFYDREKTMTGSREKQNTFPKREKVEQ